MKLARKFNSPERKKKEEQTRKSPDPESNGESLLQLIPLLNQKFAQLAQILSAHKVAAKGNETTLALPHQTTEDDTYTGYRISSGSTIVPNVWAILHDPELVSRRQTLQHPFTFDPERFFTDSHAALTSGGSGVGSVLHLIQFAEPALLFSMASVLYNFDIKCSQTPAALEFATGITSPSKFKFDLAVRRVEVELN
ncbi:hypothetical protein C8R46DRAFT_1294316 [Mycena filopes]|nr:hypothetical protein C8R46DRAFT_1294316 [Mycena filopes]